MTTVIAEAEPRELSTEDFVALLKERVAALGMTLDEFAQKLASGEIDAEQPRVAGLAMLVRARTR